MKKVDKIIHITRKINMAIFLNLLKLKKIISITVYTVYMRVYIIKNKFLYHKKRKKISLELKLRKLMRRRLKAHKINNHKM